MRLTRNERFQYRLAWTLFGLLAFVGVFGTYLMPHQIDATQRIPFLYGEVNGVQKMVNAPFAPSGDFWFGTDHRGLDVLSLLLNGARYTLGFALAVTAARFLIALPLGLYVGATGRGRSLLETLGSVFTAVPMLLILFPIFFGVSRALGINEGLVQDDPRLLLFTQLMFITLVLLGIFQLAQQFAERADFYNGKLYITAARSMGASTTRVVFRHLVPHLRPEVLFTFLTDFAQVLFIIGQLAVMSIFLGGGDTFVDEATETYVLLTNTGEWGSLIAYGANYIRVYPWLSLASAGFLTASILILSFFSRQLQKRFARPHLYKSKPLLQNKPRLAVLAAVTAVCLAVVTLVPNKAPSAVRTQAAAGGELGHDPASELMRQGMTKIAGDFMTLLERGNWNYAETYIQGKLGDNPHVSYDTFEPFNLWLEALHKRHYKYQGVGTITTAQGGRYENPYDVELLVTSPEGQTESWHLLMSTGGKSRVLAGYGGPAHLPEGDAPVLLSRSDREKVLLQQAAHFMQLLQAGNWEQARTMWGGEATFKTSPTPPEPFDKWMAALTAKRYEFLESAPSDRQYILGGNGDTITVKVKNTQTGHTAKWTLNMTLSPDGTTAHITYGRGIPAAQ